MTSLMEQMGGVKEQIEGNTHTSETLFNAIDWTLYQGIELVLKHTTLVEEVLGIYFNTPTRKKIANSSPEDFAEFMYHFYNGPENEKLPMLRKAKINRELLTLPLQMISHHYEPYCRSLVDGSMETWGIRRELMLKIPDTDVTLFLLNVKVWFDRYCLLRDAIMEKYYRLIVKDIGRYTHVIAGKVDKNDMASEYITSLLRAFSKFDTTSGAFTSYLSNWLKNARSNSMTTDEIGIAFTLPHNVRTKIGQGKGYSEVHNFSQQINEDASENTVQLLEESDEKKAFQMLISKADPTGLYRLMNAFPLEINEFIQQPT